MIIGVAIKTIKKIRNKNINFLEWEEYSNRIRFLDDFYFQQDVRLQNIKNLD